MKIAENKTVTVDNCFFKTLFNNPQHVLLQSENAITYQLIDGKNALGTIHFIIDDHIAYSPWRSLFGGFEITKKVNEESLRYFYKGIERSLKKKKVKKISIVLHANFFRKGRYKLSKMILEENGFKKTVKYKNHHIEILGKSLHPFIHAMERRKLKKANKSGLEFYEEPLHMLPIVFNFISVCRKEKRQPLNITLENLQESFEKFPAHYFILTVKKSNEIYAATVCVRVNDAILYNFLPASPLKFNDISPMVKLLDGLYTFAKKHNYKYVDLGISTTSDGVDQDSLIKFKKHMGGKRSNKLRLEKTLK